MIKQKKVNDTLQLSRDEMQSLGYKVIDMIVDHFDGIQDKPAMPRGEEPYFESFLEPLPEQGQDTDLLLGQLQENIFSHMWHPDHPRYMCFIPSSSNFVGVMGDLLATGFNVFTGVSRLSPAATMIEVMTIDWLSQMCGLPSTAGGIFVSGGSAANLMGLATARHMKLSNQTEGAVIYCSDQTHPVSERGLRILGFEQDQLRWLPSDEEYSLSLPALYNAVAEDKAAGRKPFCIVANAGATATGAVDPLPELADFCAEEGIWLHVDAAYGAAAALCEEGQAILTGLGRADSVVFDPHKWLFQPYELGCILVRDRFELRQAFSMSAELFRDVERINAKIDFKDYGIQLSRGFKALKLWLSLKTFGVESFRQAVAKGLNAAKLAEELLRATPNWQIVSPAQLGIITFRYAPPEIAESDLNALNQQIGDYMLADGFAIVNTIPLKGQIVIRICPINPRLTQSDLRETLRRLTEFGIQATREMTSQPQISCDIQPDTLNSCFVDRTN
ncbi:MAG: pyridoxal phosphate-dependent decarboxylase family protein [Ardenticatenaceae bacterium]